MRIRELFHENADTTRKYEYSTKCRYDANTMRNYYANTMKILCECDTFTSRCDDANIQANRLLRVYHAELLVRLDQFSYTLS